MTSPEEQPNRPTDVPGVRDAPPITLVQDLDRSPIRGARPLELADVMYSYSSYAWRPVERYCIELPGHGVARLVCVRVSDYRQQGKPNELDRVQVSYTMHPQTKRGLDHRGRNTLYFEFYLRGARRLGIEPFEEQVATAGEWVLRQLDAEKARRELAALNREREQRRLTEDAQALGVTLAWTPQGEPILTRSLLALILRTAGPVVRRGTG